MNHRPSIDFVSNVFTSAESGGIGNAPSSARCGTQLFCDTAQALNSPMAALSKRSPQRIWHSVSSALPAQVLMQIKFAAHLGFVMHLASSSEHLLMTQRPTLDMSWAA